MDFSRISVIRPNQTAREMICHIEILVEHCRGSIFPSTQGQERLAELGINASILPNSLAQSCARVADSKASKSTSIEVIQPQFLFGGFEFNFKIF